MTDGTLILVVGLSGFCIVMIGAAINHQLLRIAHALERLTGKNGDWPHD